MRSVVRATLAASVAVAAALAAGAPAHALVYERHVADGGVEVVIARDGNPSVPAECAPKVQRARPNCGFALGDGEHLRRVLRERPVQEVWLISGGGVLDEGMAVGRAIREYGLSTGRLVTTRIPDGRRCVSACTVAFMGGLQRIKNRTGTYEVHSGSYFLRLSADQDIWPGDDLVIPAGKAVEGAEQIWPRLAVEVHLRQVRELGRLFDYFLEMHVNQPGRPPRVSQRAAIEQLLTTKTAAPASLAPAALRDTALQIRSGGLPVLQQKLMDVEREGVRATLDTLRTYREALGPLADRAINNVRLMYDTSTIVDVAPLSDETMREFFYTREFR